MPGIGFLVKQKKMGEAIPLFLQQISVSSQSLETEPYKVMLFLVSGGPMEGERDGGQNNGEESNEGSCPLGSQPWGLFVCPQLLPAGISHAPGKKEDKSFRDSQSLMPFTDPGAILPTFFFFQDNYLGFTF